MNSRVRKTLEKFSRGKTFKRSMPRDIGGKLWVTPESGLRFWFQPLERIDPSLFRAVRQWVQPECKVWDVGANIGLFTFAAASIAGPKGHVLAIEADIYLAMLLQRSNKIPVPNRAHIDILPAAVSHSEGIAQFEIAERARASNSLSGYGASQKGGVRERQSIVTISLDWLLNHYPPPNLIKIDVEGAESMVLRGATHILNEVRPLLLCEVTNRQEEVAQIFRDSGYTMFDIDASATQFQPLNVPSMNIIACPNEKVGTIIPK